MILKTFRREITARTKLSLHPTLPSRRDFASCFFLAAAKFPRNKNTSCTFHVRAFPDSQLCHREASLRTPLQLAPSFTPDVAFPPHRFRYCEEGVLFHTAYYIMHNTQAIPHRETHLAESTEFLTTNSLSRLNKLTESPCCIEQNFRLACSEFLVN